MITRKSYVYLFNLYDLCDIYVIFKIIKDIIKKL